MIGPAPDSIIGNSAFWTIDYPVDYATQGRRRLLYAKFKTLTKTTAQMDSSTIFLVEVVNSESESNTSNNKDRWHVKIGGPYDPNNKLVTPQGLDDDGKITVDQNTLIYTVNFQNTGNAPAKNVFIIDSLSDLLDHSTIQFLESSDPMRPSYFSNGVLRVDFDDINLPDSASDPSGSIGWFTFSIKMKDSLPLGTQIRNNVDIYFDYNAPIRTNTALNTLYEPPYIPIVLDISTQHEDVTCINNDNGSATVKINTSELPYSILWSNGSNAKTLKNLSPGKYYVTISDTFGQIAVDSVVVSENRIYEDPLIGPISGPLSVQSWKSYTYSVEANAQASYLWSADGGEVLQSIANSAEIQWNAGPEGTITVTKTSDKGCDIRY